MIIIWIIAIIILLIIFVAILLSMKLLSSNRSSTPARPARPAPIVLAASDKDIQLECISDNHCYPGNKCINSTCVLVEDKCNDDSDCSNGLICKNNICKIKSCLSYTDCPNRELCLHSPQAAPGRVLQHLASPSDRNGICIPFGHICINSDDCPKGTKCINGNCKQCSSSADCLLGEHCSDGICKFPCRHDNDCNDQICLPGSGHCCPKSFTPYKNKVCNYHSDCGDVGYCNSGICTCVPQSGKQILELCNDNRDCSTNNCISVTSSQKICGYSNGVCLYDFDPSHTDPFNNSCPISSPFCISGQCHTKRNGAPCSSTEQCRSDGDNLYCVANVCSPVQASLGVRCTDNASCQSNYCADNFNLGYKICSTTPTLSPSRPVGTVPKPLRSSSPPTSFQPTVITRITKPLGYQRTQQ